MPRTWADLDRRRRELPRAPGEEDADEVVALTLSSPTGRSFLAWLRARTVEYRSPPGAPETVLRELEGARRLVGDIEMARERGEAKLTAKAKSA